ncbi:MAG TPA: KH domain-containing protein [Candidatus Saccharimonadales bacterium]|nr:KH domain-containing protein [Candidatus Saccharimonadales bacterium]
MSTIDQQFVEFVVKSLVSKPDAVKIDRRVDEKGVLLELTVDPEDLGRVIGKRGATAQSLRTLLRALGTKNEARYNLKIVDNGPAPADRPTHDTDAEPAAKSKKPTKAADDAQATGDEPDVEEPAEPEVPVAPAEPEEETEETSDRLAKARAELADLDDLDI